jgi:membrane-bound serine protease (ClpP class)
MNIPFFFIEGGKMFDILTDPNVAYLLLLASFWLGLMAVVSPGTGIFELAAIAALILAGWGVFQHPFNGWAIALLGLITVPCMVQVIRTGKLAYLIAAIASLVIGSSYLFRGEGWLPAVNPLLAFVASSLSAVFIWLITIKALEAERKHPTHDLASLVGAKGEARTAISDLGTVMVDGELWSARSPQPIPEGEKVLVIGREGLVLLVEQSNGKEDPNAFR